MTTPLHIGIALHYWTSPGDYDGGGSAHFHSGATQAYLGHLVEVGLLEKLDAPDKYGATYRSTDALRVYIDGLLSVPYPIQKWVLPEPAYSNGERTP